MSNTQQERSGPPSEHVDAGVRKASTGMRLAVGLTLVAATVLLGILGLKMGMNAGWVRGGSGVVTGGAPGVFSSGRRVPPPFRQAPDFTLQLYSGRSLRLSDLRGKPVVINFWASWCPPCREEAPLLEDMWREYRQKGVVFVGVDVWDSEENARSFLDEYGISYPNGTSRGGLTSVEYGLTGIPETIFVDRTGRVTRKWIGPFTEQALRESLDEIVDSKS